MRRLALLLALLASPAIAHDPHRPELDSWFLSLSSKGHGMCCDGSDATHLDEPDWGMENQHYWVVWDGHKLEVPDDAVVEGKNKAGHALVWIFWINGFPQVRCFMPGTMT